MKKIKMPVFKFSYRIEPDERQIIYTNICDISTPSRSFYFMVCVSTIIATYGLLANSTAVVIGAMLVAPLMGPIFGIALGLSNGDNKLLQNSIRSELLGMLLAVALAAIIGIVPLRPDFASEIMARTQPTVYDVIIALASGLAGAYAMVNRKISPALPGVAISTALVPPLATVGLCLAAHNYEWALGAFLLFVVNLLAIEFAAAAVFFISGLVKLNRENGLVVFFRRFGLSLVILLVMGVFMTQTLINIVADRALAEQLRESLSEQIKTTVGARLSELRYERKDGVLNVMAVALTPQQFEAQRVAVIEEALQKEVDPNLHLVIRSLISRDADRNGQVFIAEEEKIRQTRIAEENLWLGEVSKTLNQEVASIPGTRIVDIQNMVEKDGQRKITAVVHTPSPIDPVQVGKWEETLNASLQDPVHLVVRSVLTRDADASQYIYEDDLWQKPLSGPELEFHNQLETLITDQLRKQEPAAKLLEMYYGEKNDALLVLLQIRSPYTLRPNDIKILENMLKKELDARIQVIVRCTVGADVSSRYYLQGYDENLAKALQ